MQPTTIGDPSPTELAEWSEEACERVIQLISDLDDEQLVGPLLPTVNPLIWEVGHLAWFQEIFVLRRALGEPPIIAHADAIWDSAAIPHDTRWHLVLPSRPDTAAYMREVARRVADRVSAADATDVLRHVTRYAVHHDDVHCEAITYTRQALAYPAPALPGPSAVTDAEADAHAQARGPLPGDVSLPGGVFRLGALRSQPFVYDNEKWAHPIPVEPFAIARAPVTQADLAAFVDDGGYRRRELWGDAGWEWRTAAAGEHPLYWRCGAAGWERRHFDRWVPLEPHRPAVHVCWHEAQAYCRWAGRRLPTEAEWEAAALAEPDGHEGLRVRTGPFPWGADPISPRHANLDWEAMGTVDVAAHPEGDSSFGCRQMIGNVWEWTEDVFAPYPGFERDLYKENSEPWFGSRRVLRGGSWATRSRLMRGTLRNYFTPDRRDVIAGFRTVALKRDG